MLDVHSMTRNLILAVILISLSGVASASHYAFDGRCYETAADAVEAFGKSFPRVFADRVIYTYFTALVQPSPEASPQIQYQFFLHNLSANNVTYSHATIPLLACSKVDVETLDYTVAGSLFSFFFASVVSLWFFSKNLGLILEAVRKY